MDTAATIERNPVSTRFSLSMEMSRLTRDRFAEPVSQDQILRRERGQGNISFSSTADHEQIDHLPRLILTLAICDDHTHTCASAATRGCLTSVCIPSFFFSFFFSGGVAFHEFSVP